MAMANIAPDRAPAERRRPQRLLYAFSSVPYYAYASTIPAWSFAALVWALPPNASAHHEAYIK
jgi:hypothetical protein